MHEIFLKKFSQKSFFDFLSVCSQYYMLMYYTMLFHSSQIPYISFLKNHVSSIFPFSLSLILKSNLMLMKSWNYRTSLCSKENRFFFVPKLLFYTFDIYLIIYTAQQYYILCVQYMQTNFHQYY